MGKEYFRSEGQHFILRQNNLQAHVHNQPEQPSAMAPSQMVTLNNQYYQSVASQNPIIRYDQPII